MAIHQVIVGGESGPCCRPMEIGWVRQIHHDCKRAGVAFFLKQLGGHPNKRHAMEDFPPDLRIREFPVLPIHV
jgi:protein gp37